MRDTIISDDAVLHCTSEGRGPARPHNGPHVLALPCGGAVLSPIVGAGRRWMALDAGGRSVVVCCWAMKAGRTTHWQHMRVFGGIGYRFTSTKCDALYIWLLQHVEGQRLPVPFTKYGVRTVPFRTFARQVLGRW